jgi:putative two-component system response regulator
MHDMTTPPASTNNPPPGSINIARHPKMKVLIIDDEPANVALLEGILINNGYARIAGLTDSRLALERCQTFEPDLILLDLMMPHIDGITLLETLRAQATNLFLPVLVLTADVNEKTRLRALSAGATDFLLKPFNQLEALLRIDNLLEIRRLHIQLEIQRAALEEAVRSRGSELRDVKAKLDKLNWSTH